MPAGLRKQVNDLTGIPYPTDLYAEMSTAIHPSYYGAVHYANRIRGIENAYVSTPEAQFDPIRFLDALSIGMRTVPIVLWQFLKITERTTFPKKKQMSFMARYDRLNIEWAVNMSYFGGFNEMLVEIDRSRTLSWTEIAKAHSFVDELARRQVEWGERVVADLEREL